MLMSTRAVLDLVVRAKEQAFDAATAAMRAAYELSLGAKDTEVAALKKQVADLGEALRYERSRADALVDRLLVRDAKVAAVAPAAVAAAREKDEKAVERLREVFEQINNVGEIPPAAAGEGGRAFEFAGGGRGVLAGAGARVRDNSERDE